MGFTFVRQVGVHVHFSADTVSTELFHDGERVAIATGGLFGSNFNGMGDIT